MKFFNYLGALKTTILIAIFFVISITAVRANPHDFQILRVIDGDTVEFAAPFLPTPLKQKLSLRIYGIDTPEKGPRAECSEENLASLNAKLFTEQEIMNATSVLIYIKEWDKYGGRVLGDIILDGTFLSSKIIEQGYGREYFGGKKTSWCTKSK